MYKKLLFLFFSLISLSFSQTFLKIGYGTQGYRLGFETNVGNFYYPTYVSILGESKSEDGEFIYRYLDPQTNSTLEKKLSYTMDHLYFSLGLSIPTKVRGIYFEPFLKVKRTEFKTENTTDTAWSFGGGLGLLYYFPILKSLVIIPQAYFFYMPEKVFYYKGQEAASTGKDSLQVGAALDLNIGF